MPACEMTTMVMIQEKETGRVLVQERTKSWKGLAFPGGHVEPGESFIDCAVREVREETGLKDPAGLRRGSLAGQPDAEPVSVSIVRRDIQQSFRLVERGRPGTLKYR